MNWRFAHLGVVTDVFANRLLNGYILLMAASSPPHPRSDADLWYMLRTTDRYLYHYTSDAVLLSHILPKGKIRFSSFAALNDPYEFKSLYLIWQADTGFGDDFPPSAGDAYAANLRRDVRVAYFSADALGSEMTGGLSPIDLTERPYRRGHSLAQMWAHYGGNHAGACLVFDRLQLVEAVKTCTGKMGLGLAHGRVTYANWPGAIPSERTPRGFFVSYDEWKEIGSEALAKRHIDRGWKDLVLAKTKAWEGEQEYRILLRGAAPAYVHVPFSSALNGILLGERFPAAGRSAVAAYC